MVLFTPWINYSFLPCTSFSCLFSFLALYSQAIKLSSFQPSFPLSSFSQLILSFKNTYLPLYCFCILFISSLSSSPCPTTPTPSPSQSPPDPRLPPTLPATSPFIPQFNELETIYKINGFCRKMGN